MIYNWLLSILNFTNPSPTSQFNPLLCASLHNQITSHIIHTVPGIQTDVVVVHNYFTAYNNDLSLAKLRKRLSSPMIRFLENIDVMMPGPDDEHGARVPNFVPHLRLATPGDWWVANGGLSIGRGMLGGLDSEWKSTEIELCFIEVSDRISISLSHILYLPVIPPSQLS